ncbi:hypothetical protein MTO96_027817 [Rhipicephalus appendiculatus]
MEPERRSDDGDSGEASPAFRRVGSRTRSRSFNNSTAATATSSSPSRKEECGGSRSPRGVAAACGTTTKKAYSLESIQRCKRWRPLPVAARSVRQDAAAVRRAATAAQGDHVFDDSRERDAVVRGQRPRRVAGLPGVRGDRDAAVASGRRRPAFQVQETGTAPSWWTAEPSSWTATRCTSLRTPQHQLHRTSLPGDRSKRPLSQCLSLSCPVLSAPSVVVSDFSSCDVSPEIIEEADADLSSGGELRDYLSLGGRSCSSCSLSSTVSSASWDDEASQSDVSEAGSACSSKESMRYFYTNGRVIGQDL